MFATALHRDAETGLCYASFDDSQILKEIIAGPLCSTPENEFRELVPDSSVKLIKARLAFRSYRVVTDKRGFGNLS